MSNTLKKIKIRERKKARELIVQALYSWTISKNEVELILNDFLDSSMNEPEVFDKIYFEELFIEVIKNIDTIDEHIKKITSKDTNSLTFIELNVLRLSFFELIYKLDIPGRIIINEALEVNKKFGISKGFKYINAILDKALKDIRK